ncbi:hypothetical protein FOA52_000802 [Chlamydomonas sp. UWO 241]|nr:hypothetical protein FOA52_000802 [Chlamydomonas sp. UWO 241]
MVAWYWGAIINVVGNITINLGQNVMKLAHNQRADLECAEEKKPSIVKFRKWQIGIVVFVVGNILNFASFGFAAQSLLAALGSVQFVSNVVFASLILGEKVTLLILLSTACIIGGCLLLVLFGDHSVVTWTADQLMALYAEPAYIVYMVTAVLLGFGCFIAYLHGRIVAETPGRERSSWVTTMPVSYSIYSALVGTQAVIFSKSLAVLLRMTFNGFNQMGNWYTWVTLICFIIAAGFWMFQLNNGLMMFPIMIIVPMLQICWILFSTIEGLLYFKEYATFTSLSTGMFVLGIFIVFIGVYLLTLSARLSMMADDEACGSECESEILELEKFNATLEGSKLGATGVSTLGGGSTDLDRHAPDRSSLATTLRKREVMDAVELRFAAASGLATQIGPVHHPPGHVRHTHAHHGANAGRTDDDASRHGGGAAAPAAGAPPAAYSGGGGAARPSADGSTLSGAPGKGRLNGTMNSSVRSGSLVGGFKRDLHALRASIASDWKNVYDPAGAKAAEPNGFLSTMNVFMPNASSRSKNSSISKTRYWNGTRRGSSQDGAGAEGGADGDHISVALPSSRFYLDKDAGEPTGEPGGGVGGRRTFLHLDPIKEQPSLMGRDTDGASSLSLGGAGVDSRQLSMQLSAHVGTVGLTDIPEGGAAPAAAAATAAAVGASGVGHQNSTAVASRQLPPPPPAVPTADAVAEAGNYARAAHAADEGGSPRASPSRRAAAAAGLKRRSPPPRKFGAGDPSLGAIGGVASLPGYATAAAVAAAAAADARYSGGAGATPTTPRLPSSRPEDASPAPHASEWLPLAGSGRLALRSSGGAGEYLSSRPSPLSHSLQRFQGHSHARPGSASPALSLPGASAHAAHGGGSLHPPGVLVAWPDDAALAAGSPSGGGVGRYRLPTAGTPPLGAAGAGGGGGGGNSRGGGVPWGGSTANSGGARGAWE